MVRSRRAWIYVLSVAALLVPAAGIAYLGAVSYRDERGAIAAQDELHRDAASAIAGRIARAVGSALDSVDRAADKAGTVPPAGTDPLARYWFWIDGDGVMRIPHAPSDLSLDLSGGLDQYRDGFVVADINANSDTLSFTNGVELTVGDATGDVTEAALRRIQIREAIKAHFDKEQALFQQGVKVLTLYFIDEVVKYRDYSTSDEKGEYARIFEEEYQLYLNEVLDLDETPYIKYLKGIPTDKTHSGYFSIDKKSKRDIDPSVAARGENAGLSDDVDAYDLILKHKERLLSLAEPVRFIFSHSALREGWDNPNVFVICALKHSDNTISRRQEVGRGLRLSVNQSGDRMDHPATVHDVNVLTVVASESYKDFVAALQKDISESLSARPRLADEAYFTGKVLKTASGDVEVTPQLAKQIYKYLLKHDYTDDSDRITGAYHEAKKDGPLAAQPPELAPHAE